MTTFTSCHFDAYLLNISYPQTNLAHISKGHYRSQGKVMFSEASVSHVCPRGGGLHPEGSFCSRGGLPTGRTSIQEGGLPNTPLLTSRGGHCSGRYASSWNTFLFIRASVTSLISLKV